MHAVASVEGCTYGKLVDLVIWELFNSGEV